MLMLEGVKGMVMGMGVVEAKGGGLEKGRAGHGSMELHGVARRSSRGPPILQARSRRSSEASHGEGEGEGEGERR